MRLRTMMTAMLGGLVLLIGSGLASADDQRLRVAVTAIEAPEDDADRARALTELVVFRAGELPGLTVIGQSEIQSMLSFEETRQLVGCTDESCLAEIAGALGADQLIAGSLTRLGSTAILSLRLLDVAAARVVQRAQRDVTAGDDALVGAARELVDELFAERLASPVASGPSGSSTPPEARAAPVGELIVTAAAPASRLLVDGELVGPVPAATPLAGPSGRFELATDPDRRVTFAYRVTARGLRVMLTSQPAFLVSINGRMVGGTAGAPLGAAGDPLVLGKLPRRVVLEGAGMRWAFVVRFEAASQKGSDARAEDVAALTQQAEALLAQDRPRQAAVVAGKCLQHQAGSARCHRVMGHALWAVRRRSKARDHYLLCLSLDPGLADAELIRGRLTRRQRLQLP